MMIMDPHKTAIQIMRKRKAGMPEEPAQAAEPVQETDGDLDPRHMAAEDVMHAIHARSPHHLLEALKNFHDMHMMHREREEQMAPREEEHLDMESQLPEL